MPKYINPKLATVVVFACFFFSVFVGNATASPSEEEKLIQTFHEDVTGDGIKETIRLKATPLSENTNYYQNILLHITSSEEKKWEIPLGGGYQPKLSFVDLNHDGINNIFFTDSRSSFDDNYPFKAYSLKDETLKELPKPNLPFVKGEFSDQFKIDLQLDPSDSPIAIDLTEKAQAYIQTGVYDKSGHVTKNPTSISGGNITKIEPVFLGKQQGYALRSHFLIKGAAKDDHLGIVETLWYLKNGQWQNLQTQWQPK